MTDVLDAAGGGELLINRLLSVTGSADGERLWGRRNSGALESGRGISSWPGLKAARLPKPGVDHVGQQRLLRWRLLALARTTGVFEPDAF